MCKSFMELGREQERDVLFFLCAALGKVTGSVGSCPCRNHSSFLFQIDLKQRFGNTEVR